jgi:iron complex outermembrane receptor protein
LIWLALAFETGVLASPLSAWEGRLDRIEQGLLVSVSSGSDLSGFAGELEQLRTEVMVWLLEHFTPDLTLHLPEAIEASAGYPEILEAAQQLRSVFDQIDSAEEGPFFLGMVEVTVTAERLSPGVSDQLVSSEMRSHDLRTLTEALRMFPGATTVTTGPRNEGQVSVRGFDARQVPLFLDGIPISIPFDGYFDLNRFTTFDLAQVRVSKGYTSPLFGPNTLGGSINLVSRKPRERWEGDFWIGAGSGRSIRANVNGGSRSEKWYLQTGASWLEQGFFLMPSDSGSLADSQANRRENSDQRDAKLHFKFGLTPNALDEFAVGVTSQRGRKGNPPYLGADPEVRVRYWRWPSWDRDQVYFVSQKSLGAERNLKLRAFYDSFRNELASFDDDRYSTQTRPYAFNSFFDDYSVGGSAELGAGRLGRHDPRVGFSWKDDVHRENNLGEPVRTFRDRLLSIGVEDAVVLGERTVLVAGLGLDYLETLRADDFQDGQIVPFPRSSARALNPQVELSHSLEEKGSLSFGIWRRARFPTMKDRFSYRLGLALPNPNLNAERAVGLEAGYSVLLAEMAFLEVNLYQHFIGDLIQVFYLEPNLFQLQNVGKVNAFGSEINLSIRWSDRIETRTSYSYLNRSDASNSGIPLTERPRHVFYGGLSWSLLDRLSVRADLRGEAGRWNLNQAGNLYRMTDFVTCDIIGSYVWGDWEIQAGVDNLFDQEYEFYEGYPEPGRSIFGNLGYRF